MLFFPGGRSISSARVRAQKEKLKLYPARMPVRVGTSTEPKTGFRTQHHSYSNVASCPGEQEIRLAICSMRAGRQRAGHRLEPISLQPLSVCVAVKFDQHAQEGLEHWDRQNPLAPFDFDARVCRHANPERADPLKPG